MRKIALFLTIALSLVSCISRSTYERVLEESKELKVQMQAFEELKVLYNKVQDELAGYKNAPDILYSQALECIKVNDRNGLASICESLHKFHPNSSEYSKVQQSLDKMDKDIADKEAAAKAKRMQAVNKLKKRYDDVSAISWYYNPYFTHYNNSNHMSIYMGKRTSGEPWLRLLMSYYGEDWIFFEKAYLSYDGNTREIPFNQFDDKETENSGGYVWEWIDVSVDSDLLEYLRRMVGGKVVKMRLTGKYTHDKILTSTEINALKDMLLGYDVLLNGE